MQLAVLLFHVVSECETYDNMALRFLRAVEFLLLYRHKHFVRNNGLMGTGVEILIHEAIIFNLNCAGTDCLLEQHPPSIFFIP